MSESKNVNPKEQAFILARLNTKFGMLLLDNKKKKPANEHMAEALSILKPIRNVPLNIGHKYQMAETYNDYAYLKHDEKKI